MYIVCFIENQGRADQANLTDSKGKTFVDVSQVQKGFQKGTEFQTTF